MQYSQYENLRQLETDEDDDEEVTPHSSESTDEYLIKRERFIISLLIN